MGGLFSGAGFGLRLSGFGEAMFILQWVHDSRYPWRAVASRQLPVVSKTLTTEGTGEHRASIVFESLSLSFCELREHLLGIDGDENSSAAGQHFVLVVEDLGD